MVPTFTCGLSRSNFSFATLCLSFLEDWPAYLAGSAHGLARSAFGYLFRDVRRNLVVPVELHRVARPALSVGTQVGGVAEHRGQRDTGLDRDGVAARLLALHPSAAAGQVADDRPQEV